MSGCLIWIFTPPQGWLHRKGSPSLRKSAVGSEVLRLWPQLGTHQKWTWRWKLPAKLWKHPQPTTKRWPSQEGSKRLLNKNLQHPNLLVYVWSIDLYRLLRPCSKNISIICFLKSAWHTMLQKSGGFLQRRLVLQQLAERYLGLGILFCGTTPNPILYPQPCLSHTQTRCVFFRSHLPPWWVRSFPSQLPNPQALVSGKSWF